eukprot:8093919-Lingulodinium_polyedra.AAC.1
MEAAKDELTGITNKRKGFAERVRKFDEDFMTKQRSSAARAGSTSLPRTAKRQKTNPRTEMMPMPSRFTEDQL